MPRCQEVRKTVLRPAASREHFDLHLAAVDLSLIDPIIIRKAEDIQAVNWRNRGLEPFEHQVQNLITFCRRLPVALIADDVGLGKTISAGLILSELMARRRVRRTLVVCPKMLAPHWVSEFDEKFGIVAMQVIGADLDRQLRSNTPVVVTTFDSIRSRWDMIETGLFDMLILDEAHKLRNLHGPQKPPQLAIKTKEALERRPFRYVLMLTATPIQNRIWDLYSLLDLLKTAEGKPNPLGAHPQFQQRFLRGSDGRALQPEMTDKFRQIVGDNLSRTRRGEVRLPFPDRIVDLVRADLTPDEQQLQEIVGRHIGHLNALTQISLVQAMMSSPQALTSQALNMARTGTLPNDAAQAIKLTASRVARPAKLEVLMRLLVELRQKKPEVWRAIIFTLRHETQLMIGAALAAAEIRYGFIRGNAAEQNQRAIHDLSRHRLAINVIVSTDAGAEGINLQKANVVINYDLPWNPMIVEQRIGRVQRLKSEYQNVIVLNIVGRDTVEEKIVGRLTQKLLGISQAIGDIESILEAGNLDEDSTKSIESRIRELVVASLAGRNIAAAQSELEDDIERAKKLFEEQKKEIDDKLGRPGAEPLREEVPEIKRRPPRMKPQEFVLAVKKIEGYELQALGEGRYEARAPGRPPEVISFLDQDQGQSDAIFGGKPLRCYAPGQPAYERLVQYWVDHHAHYVHDGTQADPMVIESLARSWCAQFPELEFAAAHYAKNQQHFAGEVHIKSRAGNGVDSFEKTLRGKIPAPRNHQPITSDDGSPIFAFNLSPTELVPRVTQQIQKAVENDADVSKFCDFYEKRLATARREAGFDGARQLKIERDFRPFVQAEVLGIEGQVYESGAITVEYRVGRHKAQTQLSVLPALRRLLAQPPTALCEITGRALPTEAVARCAATGKTVSLSLLDVTSDGQLALADQIGQCEATGRRYLKSELLLAPDGRWLHRDQFVKCPVSGQMVLRELVVQSDVSGELAAPDQIFVSPDTGRKGIRHLETVTCVVTGKTMLKDEAILSERSGRYFHKSACLSSALSGRPYPPDDLMTCTFSHTQVGFDEIAFSEETGRFVRKDLLGRLFKCPVSGQVLLREQAVKSDISGESVAPDQIFVSQESGSKGIRGRETVICAATGREVLTVEAVRSQRTGNYYHLSQCQPSAMTGRLYPLNDLVVCAQSGTQVGFDEVGKCEVTKKLVRKDLLVCSNLSGRTALPKAGIQLADGRFALPDEAATCEWDGQMYATGDIVECRLSALAIARWWTNRDRELIPFRQLLDGAVVTEDLPPDAIAMVQRLYASLGVSPHHIWSARAPLPEVFAVCAECRSLFGFRRQYVGMIVALGKPVRRLGRPAMGKRIKGVWVVG